ncbi:MAPEG family protein [Algicola sagamiensis]|uniref:MAPEG family protein n=1 Tax=Algicola sagamiensis TaxID=163869 RepID=UPI00037A18DE|nr:MAPEG family protein [Algicola sagamiensis]
MIVPMYAAVFALFYIYLALRVIKARRQYQVALGDGQEKMVQKAIRVHGNFSEYVPFALLLLFFLEQKNPNTIWLHSLCIALCVGRLICAYGVSAPRENLKFRVTGMVITFAVMIAISIHLLITSL